MEQEERHLAEMWEAWKAEPTKERPVVLAGLALVALLAAIAVAGLLLPRIPP